MSCKPLVSQKTVTWKKERKSFTNQSSQPSCAPPFHAFNPEAEKSKVALNHQQGEVSAHPGRIYQHPRIYHQPGRPAHGVEIGQTCFSTPMSSSVLREAATELGHATFPSLHPSLFQGSPSPHNVPSNSCQTPVLHTGNLLHS